MKIFITLAFLVFFSFAFGQNEAKIAQILSTPHSTTPRISCENSVSTTLLPCDFSESTFDVQGLKSTLKNCAVVKIYYVNTTYKSSTTFNQHALDIQRFRWLNAQFPEFFSDPLLNGKLLCKRVVRPPKKVGHFFTDSCSYIGRHSLKKTATKKSMPCFLSFNILKTDL